MKNSEERRPGVRKGEEQRSVRLSMWKMLVVKKGIER